MKTDKTIPQFQGETREDAIINHFAFDLKEEDTFFEFIQKLGYDANSDDETIFSLVEMFRIQLTFKSDE